MSRLFGIAGVQMSVIPWDTEATIDKMALLANRIGRSFPWVEMILFHELAPSAFVQFDEIPDAKTWKQLPQTIPGPMTDRLCDIARKEKRWIIPGSMYERDNDVIYNTSIVISPDGDIIAKYRKLFPWYPGAIETPGDSFCVFDVPDVGRFGVTICYDMWFPEVMRSLIWMGAEVILHPTLTLTSDRELELVLSQANAIMNQCYFIDINGVGAFGGGYSMIIDPDGRVLHKAGSHETILTEILDLNRVRHAREFGNLGLTQTLKQIRDSNIKFPPYEHGFSESKELRNLGDLKLHRKLDR